jgi:hypothetical protein
MGKRHRVRGSAAIAVLVAIVAMIAGSASGARTAAPTTAAKIKLPKKTIGIMGPINAAEIIKLGTDATVAAAKALGWKTIQIDPLGDPAKMGAGMTSLVNS